MSDSFASVPVNRLFGFELRGHDGGTASVAFRPRAEHAQERGVLGDLGGACVGRHQDEKVATREHPLAAWRAPRRHLARVRPAPQRARADAEQLCRVLYSQPLGAPRL
jgi:hypothetical protein